MLISCANMVNSFMKSYKAYQQRKDLAITYGMTQSKNPVFKEQLEHKEVIKITNKYIEIQEEINCITF